MPEITVVVADDHPLFRKGLVDAVAAGPAIRIVAEAADGDAALAAIRARKPALAILDIDMPGKSGIDVARAVQAERLETRIVFLTMHAERDALVQALDAGARGYVLKESAASEIVACINMVASGRQYVSAALAGHLIDRARPTATEPAALGDLTPTERAVLRLVANGRSTKEISTELDVAPKTVENHRANLCAKLNIRGANALLRYALAHRDLIA
jgi:DNA-binding NarL/FixJ family response regulator